MTTWTPATLDSFDTPASIWQKLNQIGFVPGMGAAGPGPQIQEGIGTFQADDLSWHQVDLSEEDDGEGGTINVPRVAQTDVVDPGVPYLGYAVMRANDGTKHKMSLLLDGGIYNLYVDQAETVETLSGAILLAAPSGFFPVTVIKEGGIYVWKAGQ